MPTASPWIPSRVSPSAPILGRINLPSTGDNKSLVEYSVLARCTATRAQREDEHEYVASLLGKVDWHHLLEMLLRAHLLPTLGPRILAAARDSASDEFASAVADSVDEARRKDTLLHLTAERAVIALAEAGVPASPIKGPQLGEYLYGEPGRRLSSDVDLLVAPERLSEAVEVVRGLGYASPIDYTEDEGLPLLHFALPHATGELPPIELHWRIHWYETSFSRERLLRPSLRDGGDWRPAPVDELAALLLFYARDGFTGFRHATDLGAWWDRVGAELEDGALEETIVAYPALGQALATAAVVAEEVVGLPGRRIVGARARLSLRGRLAARLADPHPYASSQQLFAEIGLIDGLLTPIGDLRAFARRQIAPPREVIREHAEKAHDAPVKTRLGYSIRVLGRYGLTLARLLHLPPAMRARFG